MAAYAEDQAVQQQSQPLAEKLFGLMKRIDGDGHELARSAEGLADKLSGTIPSQGEANELRSRGRDNVHELVDLINDKLTSLFVDMRVSLERSHRAVGNVGPDLKAASLPVEKASRY